MDATRSGAKEKKHTPSHVHTSKYIFCETFLYLGILQHNYNQMTTTNKDHPDRDTLPSAPPDRLSSSKQHGIRCSLLAVYCHKCSFLYTQKKKKTHISYGVPKGTATQRPATTVALSTTTAAERKKPKQSKVTHAHTNYRSFRKYEVQQKRKHQKTHQNNTTHKKSGMII